MVYTNLKGNKSHLVQTSWALLTLIKAGQVSITLFYMFNQSINPSLNPITGVGYMFNGRLKNSNTIKFHSYYGSPHNICSMQQGEVDPTPIERGVRLIINTQMEDGDFPPQDITGIFMKSCTIEYSSYRHIFPIWVLGEYYRLQARRSAMLLS
ncbi:Lupeol synthase [Bienertia sinuspersici]